MKTCKDCGMLKPFTDFYKHPKMADGYVNGCKLCQRTRITKVRQENINEYRLREREYAKTPAKREGIARVSKAWREKYPERYKAHTLVGNAVRDGRLFRPDACETCNTKTNSRQLHGHHDDYSKPLDVKWLCAACHSAIHD